MSDEQNGIAAARKRLGASLEEFATAADLSPSGYWRKEKGQSRFSAEEALALTDYVNSKRGRSAKVTLRDLFGAANG